MLSENRSFIVMPDCHASGPPYATSLHICLSLASHCHNLYPKLGLP